MYGGRDYQFAVPVDALDELGFLLPPAQTTLAEQRDGLAVTLLRVESEGYCGCGDVHPVMRANGQPVILPALLDFSPDHIVSGSQWASEELGHYWGFDQWDHWESKVGLLEVPDDFDRRAGELNVRRLWDCWPVTQSQGDRFMNASRRAWHNSKLSLWPVYWHLKEQFEDRYGEEIAYDLEEFGGEERIAYQEYQQLSDTLNDPDIVYVDPVDLLDFSGDFDLHVIWQSLLRSSQTNWAAARMAIDPQHEHAWYQAEGAFNSWSFSQ